MRAEGAAAEVNGSPKPRTSSLVWDIAGTTLSSVLSNLSLLAIISLISSRVAPEEVGLYLLARRVVMFVAPLVLVATQISLPRYVALAESQATRRMLVLAGFLLTIGNLAAALVVVSQFGGPISRLLEIPAEGVLFWWWIYLLGHCFYSLLYAYFRGAFRMGAANLLNATANGVLPLVAVVLVLAGGGECDARLLIVLSAAPLHLLALPILSSLLWRAPASDLSQGLRKLISYGIPRVPAGLSLQGMTTLSLLLVQRFRGPVDVALLATAQTALKAIQGMASNFSLVILPRAARMARDRRAQLTRRTSDLLEFCIDVGGLAAILGWFSAATLARLFLGPDLQASAPLIQVLSLSVPPMMAFVLLRGIIDGAEVRAVNMRNIAVSLAVSFALMLGLGVYGAPLSAFAWAVATGFMLLGTLSVHYVVSSFQLELGRIRWKQTFSLLLLVGLASFGLGHALAAVDSFLPSVLLLGLGLTVVGSVYLIVLWRQKRPWLLDGVRRLRTAVAGAAPPEA